MDVHFLLESDFKISLFIQRQVAPKSSNYAFFLKKYIEKKAIEKKVNQQENDK